MALFGRNSLTILQRIMRIMGRDPRRGTPPAMENETFDWDWEERRNLYSTWESLYANSIYDDQANGGFREIILRDTLKTASTDLPLHGFYNPVGCVTDSYQNILRGQFGKEIKIATSVGEATERRPVNDRILAPITNIWKWSNLNNQKESMQLWASLLGTAGLRIEAQLADPNAAALPINRRRARIRPVHPREIVDFNEDPDGNITDVLLEYSVLEGGLGDRRNDEPTTYREILSKNRLVKMREEKTILDIPNELGVCPFVLIRHKDLGAQFGVPAHFGSETIIHQINWLITRTGISVDRHVFAKWFAAASGAMPQNFDLGDTSVAYVQMGPGDTAPKLEAIVAKLDFIGIERLLAFFIAHLRQRQPETVLSSLEALSGQSGETIAKLLIPIEERILIARGHYEHALVRAMQIALSWGIVGEMWDLGSGVGTKDAADAAYLDGLEDFAFNDRSALPETVFDKINRAKADQAAQTEKINNAKNASFVSTSQQMRMIGMTDAEIAKVQKERATQDVAPDIAMSSVGNQQNSQL